MKTVKIEEAIRQWRESGRKCRSDAVLANAKFYGADYFIENYNMKFLLKADFILEPRKKKIKGEGYMHPNINKNELTIFSYNPTMSGAVKVTYEFEAEEE